MYRNYRNNTVDMSETTESATLEFSNLDWGSVAMTTDEWMTHTAGPPVEDKGVKRELTVEDFIKEKWEREQCKLKKQLLLEDVDDWSRNRITHENEAQFPFRQRLQYIGGVDISFVKGDNINACAAFVVLNFPELEVVYEDLSMVQLTAPYIPGFLAFREADFLVQKIQKLKEFQPEIMPQVVLVDGNGILHPRGFGLASHLGVLTNLPMVGAAKNLLCVDGITRSQEFLDKIKESLKKAGDRFPLIGESGRQHGMVYRSHDTAANPIFVSPGHNISMDTAVWVVEQCIKYRVPEPIRQADLLSREYLRVNWDCNKHKEKKQKSKRKRPSKETQNHPQQEGTELQEASLAASPSSDSDTDASLGLSMFD